MRQLFDLTLMTVTVVALLSCSSVKTEVSYQDVLIEDVPHVVQKPDFCGEACAEMYLKKLGKPIDQDEVFRLSGLDPALGRGCYTPELAVALKKLGFKVGTIWNKVNPAAIDTEMEQQWHALHADLLTGIPSIICTRYNSAPRTTEHFRLILGYDHLADEVIYHEPAEPTGAYKRMKRPLFLALWPLKYAPTEWTIIRFRLEAPAPEPPAPAMAPAAPDYSSHVRKLEKELKGKNFTIIVEEPFVVLGDGTPYHVSRSSKRTVRWAVDMLRKDYFKKNPPEIINIWLFKDKTSYRKHTRELFNTVPTTPFGYYSEEHDALIMDISTGGGTLVHEIVHPFMKVNFPACPSWFNEGLASLYEQCGDRNGRITGFTNWRLKGLQEGIRKGLLDSFETLCKTSTDEFYGDNSGLYYAQARYLCYYLQEKKLLRSYYHTFRANAARDPGGYETLKTILGSKDMAAFQKTWERFILSLRFP